MRLLIKNGRVIDPAQRIDAQLNLLAADGKIDCLTSELPEADEVLDADGLIVCPGFIDMHSHEDPVKSGLLYRDEEKANLACLLRMGVTTCLAGNCGDNFCEPADFLDLAEREGCYVNVLMLAGYTWFRKRYSSADRYSKVSPKESERICCELSKALERGCAGVSFGLEYVPGMDCAELSAAAATCSASEKLIAAHIRGCAEQAVAAAEEVMEVGRQAGVPVELSHIGSMAGYGNMKDFLRAVEARRGIGQKVWCDCYPYSAFSTTIGSAPYDDLSAIHCRPADIEMCEGEFKGCRCTEEIFEKERREHPEYLTVGHVMREEDIRMALLHPNVMIGSDCFLSAGNGHPRAAGTFPRYLSRCTGENGLSLFAAIEKITALPAERLGLRNKGSLHQGADADLVLFDAEKILDRSTFSEPTLPPDGITAVLIGGQIAVRKGRILKGRLGKAIRK
ncbi:MAG: amidohydrolase family protein [Oscillospiraceae bacterium]|nr:amidohydrolase family protein [Oscillospiraceae bacterium]